MGWLKTLIKQRGKTKRAKIDAKTTRKADRVKGRTERQGNRADVRQQRQETGSRSASAIATRHETLRGGLSAAGALASSAGFTGVGDALSAGFGGQGEATVQTPPAVQTVEPVHIAIGAGVVVVLVLVVVLITKKR